LILSFSTYPCLAVSAGVKETETILQEKLDSIASAKIVPGITFSVLYNNGTKLSLASGLADIEDHEIMKPDAVMFSGSVGKTYVAAVILKLCEDGKIDLKAKAVHYLRDEEWFLKVPNAKDITVEMLLNHTAGIPEYVYKKEIWRAIKSNPDKIWSVEERLSYIYNEPPSNEAGKGWNYADAHYLILGRIIEKVTGQAYYDVLTERILKPCKLRHTFPADRRSLPGLIAGYTGFSEALLLPKKMVTNNQYAFNPQLEWTGGGLVTTVSDLTLWAKQLYGGDVLKSDSKKLMLTPAPFKTNLFENARYGLGCIIGETDGVTYYGHTGFAPGYITIMQYIPAYELSIAMQMNTDSPKDNYNIKQFFNRLKNTVIDNCK
jgi:D-alanyl-D-alanine carboxypeptidase